MPDTRPYTWGIYVGLNTLLLGAVIIVAGIVTSTTGGQPSDVLVALFVLSIGGAYALAGYHTVRRHRGAFVFATLFSFNVFWWVANSIYLRNRWNELKETKAQRHGPELTTQAREQAAGLAPPPATISIPELPKPESRHTTGQGTFE